MTCNACGEKPKNTAKDFTKAVIEINNPETLVLLRKVTIPASMGTEEDVPATIGKYHNVILNYESNNHTYIYSSDGIPTLLESEVPQEVLDRIAELEENLEIEIEEREGADEELQSNIDDVAQDLEDFKNSPDVVDIVQTYAALQAYDTSSLSDNDIVRVLQDEQHDGQSTYYRWSATTQNWTYIGAVGDYYTKGQVDDLLDAKQDVLTPGANITIDANNEISATDTTYSDFVGTDGTTAGTSGLVPAPATTDVDKFLKSDGTWAISGSSGIKTLTVDDYNYPANNPTYVNPALLEPGIYLVNDDNVYIYNGVNAINNRTNYIFIITKGYGDSSLREIMVINGTAGASSNEYKITFFYAYINNPQPWIKRDGVISSGYVVNNLTTNNANRVLSAAQGRTLKNLIDGLVNSGSGAPTTSTVGTIGQLYEDTANGKLYQCTAVSGSTYTWSEIGAGGSGGDTVYSDKTTSNRDAGGAVYIGNLNANQEEQPDPTTTDYHYKYFWALPLLNTTIPNDNSINILGTNVQFHSVVIGEGANNPIGSDSVAIGSANVRAQYGVSVGNGAYIENNLTNSVALGSRARPTRAGEVNIGNSLGQGYNNTNYRVLGGVHDPIDAHDAATKGYVDSQAGGGITELTVNDYNYPTSNPDRVALWLLDNGVYSAPAGVMVAASTTSYPWYNTSDKTILVGGSDTVKGIYTFLNGKVDVVTTQASDGTEADEYTLLESTQVVQTTGTSTTDVMSQSAVTNAIPTITMTTADPGEGATLAANHFIGVYE